MQVETSLSVGPEFCCRRPVADLRRQWQRWTLMSTRVRLQTLPRAEDPPAPPSTCAVARRVRVLELRSARGTGGGPEKTILNGAALADPARYAVTFATFATRAMGSSRWTRTPRG